MNLLQRRAKTKKEHLLAYELSKSREVRPTDDFQIVEYIESSSPGDTNSIKLDIGYVFEYPDIKVEIKFLKDNRLTSNLYGVDTSSTTAQLGRQMFGNLYANNVYVGSGGRNIRQIFGFVDDLHENTEYEYKYEMYVNSEDEQMSKLTLNGESHSKVNEGTYEFKGSNLTCALFSTHANVGESYTYCMAGKIWYAKFYDRGKKVRDLIPVRRKSDNKPGFWDLCGSICEYTGMPFYIDHSDNNYLEAGPDVNARIVLRQNAQNTSKLMKASGNNEGRAYIEEDKYYVEK